MSKSNTEDSSSGCAVALLGIVAMLTVPLFEAAILCKAWEWHFSKLIPIQITFGQAVAFSACLSMLMFRPGKDKISQEQAVSMVIQQFMVLALIFLLVAAFV